MVLWYQALDSLLDYFLEDEAEVNDSFKGIAPEHRTSLFAYHSASLLWLDGEMF